MNLHGRFRVGATLLSFALIGCVSTVFESPPGNALSDCDSHWVGSWRVHGPQPEPADEDEVFLRVSPECKTLQFVEGGKVDEISNKIKLNFAKIGRQTIVAARLDEEPGADPNESQWRKGFHYFAYETRANEIRLRPVDDKRVAKLIIEDKLQGRVEQISRYPGAIRPGDGALLNNYVAGNAAEMKRALDSADLFSDAGHLILVRVAEIPLKSSHDRKP